MWKAEKIQFSWFSKDFRSAPIDSVYLDLVGNDADSVRKFNDPNPFTSPILCEAIGKHQGFIYQVQISPIRLDFVISKPVHDISIPITYFELHGGLEKVMGNVKSLNICKSLEVNRLALIVYLGDLSEDSQAQTDLFFELCPMELNNRAISDLNFRFNRTKSVGDNIEINRLISYSLNKIDGIGIEEIMDGKNRKVDHWYNLNVTLDFNTVPADSIEFHQIEKIWTNLASEVEKISENPCVRDME